VRRIASALGLVLALVALGPALAQEPPPPTALGTALLADQLVQSLRGAEALAGRRVAVLPFVDLHDLQTVADLGRVVGEELASALHFRNYHLAEIRGDDQLLLARRVGELYLARTGPERLAELNAKAIQAVMDKYNLGGLVVGTYAALVSGQKGWLSISGGDQVALNARLVEPLSGAVLAAATTKISADGPVKELLRRRTSALAPATQEIRARR